MRETGETSINMPHHLVIGWLAALRHVQSDKSDRADCRSSPSSTKVGQVAVQKPQYALAQDVSDSLTAGLVSWASEKFVCIFSCPLRRPHTCGKFENVLDQTFLEAKTERCNCVRLRMENRTAARMSCPARNGVACPPTSETAARGLGASVMRNWKLKPDQASAQSENRAAPSIVESVVKTGSNGQAPKRARPDLAYRGQKPPHVAPHA